MSQPTGLSYEQFRAHRQAEARLRQEYQAYLVILDKLRRTRRRRKIFTVSAIVGTMFIGFCALAYAPALQAAGVPGTDVLVAIRNLVPSESIGALLRADILGLFHALIWIAGVMDSR